MNAQPQPDDALQAHEIAAIFPLIQGHDFDELCADIERHGLREPIWLYEGKILDGRNRYEACQITGTAVQTRTYDGDDPVGFVLSLNLHRRHLTESQRGMVAASIANLPVGRPDNSANLQSSSLSRADAAKKLNVSERTVNTAKKVQEHGTPELIDSVNQGRVSVSAAADVATLPKAEQAELIAKGEHQILAAAKQIREQKSAARREQNSSVAATKMQPTSGTYSTIVIDPPWNVQKIERDNRPNQTNELDYPTMSLDELVAFGEIVNGCASEHAHLFMWTTQKWLPPAIDLLKAWDWKYVLAMVWHKNGGPQPFGLPQYNCEFCLYARKGSPEFADVKAFNTCFNAPRREHSRKPNEFYALIKRVTHDGRIDIFSREKRDGFAQYGNEAGKFSVASSKTVAESAAA